MGPFRIGLSGRTQLQFANRSTPWVTLGLMGTMLFVFLAGDTSIPETAVTQPDQRSDAAAYWQSHAYLEAPREFVERTLRDIEPQRRQLYLEAVRELGTRSLPLDAQLHDFEQKHLDALVKSARAAVALTGHLPADHRFRRFGWVPAAPSLRGLATHVFLEPSGWHLLASLILLYLLAGSAEVLWGSARLAGILVAVTSLSAGLGWAAARGSDIPWIGAQPSLIALLFLFVLHGDARRVRLIATLPGRNNLESLTLDLHSLVLVGGVLSVSSGYAFGLVLLNYRQDVSATPILCGALVGLIGAGIWRQLDGKALDALASTAETAAAPDPIPLHLTPIQESSSSTAPNSFEACTAALDANPADAECARALVHSIRGAASASAAEQALCRHITHLLHHGDPGAATDLWLELVAILPEVSLPISERLSLVPLLLERSETTEARHLLEACVAESGAALAPSLAMRIVELGADLAPAAANEAGGRLLAYPDLHESKRARVRMLLGHPPDLSNTLTEIGEPRDSTAEPIPEASLSAIDDAFAAAQDPKPVHSKPLAQWDETDKLELAAAWQYLEPQYLGTNPVLPDPEPLDLDAEATPAAGPTDGASSDPRPDDSLSTLPRYHDLAMVTAAPIRFAESVLYFRLANGRKAKVAYEEIEAVAVAAIRELSRKPVVVIDLLLNWTELGHAPLRSIRLRSDTFDPSKLVEAQGRPTRILRAFIAELLQRSQGRPIPDPDAAHGLPFRVFDSLRAYERGVLKVDC